MLSWLSLPYAASSSKSTSSLPGSMPTPCLLHSHPSHPSRRILDLFLPRHLSHCLNPQLTATSASSKFLEVGLEFGTRTVRLSSCQSPTTSVKTLPVPLGSVCIFACVFSLASGAHFVAPVADPEAPGYLCPSQQPSNDAWRSWLHFTPGWKTGTCVQRWPQKFTSGVKS